MWNIWQPYSTSPPMGFEWQKGNENMKLMLATLVCVSCSAVSASLRPLGLWPARSLCPWDSPGKNTATLWMIIFISSGSTYFVSSASTSESILSKLINLHGTWNLRSFTDRYVQNLWFYHNPWKPIKIWRHHIYKLIVSY